MNHGSDANEPAQEPADAQQDALSQSLGDPRIDAAVASLHDLAERDLHDHAGHYEQIHSALRGALDDDAGQQATDPAAAPADPADPDAGSSV